MIIIYPMLTSGSVAPNVLPGIIKAVEKYILLYNTDEVLKAAGMTTAGSILTTGTKAIGKVAAAAAVAGAGVYGAAKMKQYMNADVDNTLQDGDPISELGIKDPNPMSIKNRGQQQGPNISIKTGGGGGSGVKPSLDIPKGETVSLEPTWLQVTTQKKGLQILGVKVVPFRIKSPDPITTLLAQDKQLNYLLYLTKKYGRGIGRVFFRLMKRVKVPILKDKAITGDPMKDVLLGQSAYGKNMFICMSQMDLENENIFATPRGVQKLQKLGWASFIIADDVNRRATFCMKEFQGVCSVVPFNYMFTSFGKDFNQAYEDLEDLKKASGPFFNMRTNRRRAFSESKTTVDKYLELIQGK